MDNKDIDFLIAFDEKDEMSDGRMAEGMRFLREQLQTERELADRLAHVMTWLSDDLRNGKAQVTGSVSGGVTQAMNAYNDARRNK